jgi:hypothetical protein
VSRNKNRNQEPSKSGTRLNHSAYTIEDGHGGLKRNYVAGVDSGSTDTGDDERTLVEKGGDLLLPAAILYAAKEISKD